MMLIHQRLIKADDIVIDWLSDLGLLKDEWDKRIAELGCIPLDIETEIRNRFRHILNDHDRRLLSLLIDKGSIDLGQLCISEDDWRKVLDEGDCSSAVLANNCLIYELDCKLFPNEPMYDTRIQYLVGLENDF